MDKPSRAQVRSAFDTGMVWSVIVVLVLLVLLVLLGVQMLKTRRPDVRTPTIIRLYCIEGYLYGVIESPHSRAPVPLFEHGRPRACPDAGDFDVHEKRRQSAFLEWRP